MPLSPLNEFKLLTPFKELTPLTAGKEVNVDNAASSAVDIPARPFRRPLPRQFELALFKIELRSLEDLKLLLRRLEFVIFGDRAAGRLCLLLLPRVCELDKLDKAHARLESKLELTFLEPRSLF